MDLENFFTDIHKYLRFLEEAIILTLKDYGIESGRIEGLTGVWLDWTNPVKARKNPVPAVPNESVNHIFSR